MYKRPLVWRRSSSYDPKKRYATKKPIRSFRDLEVYQKALDAAVVVAKDVYPLVATSVTPDKESLPEYPFRDNLLKLSLEIPRWIAEAHSLRFDFPAEGITMLERARVGSNRMIVYLEQVRGIYAKDGNRTAIDETIKQYADNRVKMFRLAAAWKKWMAEKK